MTRSLLIAVPLLVAALAGTAASAGVAPAEVGPAGARIRECGSYAPGGGAGVSNITTRVTPCRVARRMARNFYRGRWNNVPRRSDRPFRRGPYRCINRRLGWELGDLRCPTSRGRLVRWQHGA